MKFSRKLALAALLLAFVIASVEAFCCCKKATEQLGSCTVNFKVSGCLKSAKNREWHFKATATEADSKLTTSFQWASSAQEAIQAASKKLFEENPQLAAKCYSYSANSQQALARDVAGLMPEWADVEASWGTIEWEEDEFRIDDPIFHNDGEVGLQW